MTYVYVIRDAYRATETVAITRDCRVYRVGGGGEVKVVDWPPI